MKYLIYIIAVLVGFGLEVGLFGQWTIGRATPDLVLVLIIFFAVKRDGLDAYVPALVGGLLMDMYSGTPVGAFTLGYVIIAALAHAVYQSLIVHEMTWKQVPIIVISAVVFLYLWMMGFSWLLLQAHWVSDSILFSDIRSIIIPHIFYTLLLMYPMVAACTWLDQLIESIQRQRHVVK